MLEEKDYYAALGVEQPGEKEQEAAEPVEAQPAEAVSDTPTGEQVQEPAEPAEIETQEVQTGSLEQEEETDDAPAEPDGSQEEKKHEMSQQQRRQNAAQRRKRELDEAMERVRQEEQEKFKQREKAFFTRAGLKNPYKDNKPLENFEDFEEWYTAQKNHELEQDLRSGKLTPEGLQEVLQSLPQIRQVQELAEQMQKQKEQGQTEQFQQQVAEELRQIQKLDPTVKEIGDILQMETGTEFTRYVKEKGLSFLEAFKLANADQIAQRRADRQAQRALQAVTSKSHLVPTRGSAEDSMAVPHDVAEMYRAMDPSLSAQDIQREYNKWYKQSHP